MVQLRAFDSLVRNITFKSRERFFILLIYYTELQVIFIPLGCCFTVSTFFKVLSIEFKIVIKHILRQSLRNTNDIILHILNFLN
jgi:hypothetical protein